MEEVCEPEVVETCNIGLAAALLTAGGDAVLDRDHHDASDPRHVKIFIKGTGLKAIQEKWYSRKLQGDLRAYSENFKDVKAFIHTLGA